MGAATSCQPAAGAPVVSPGRNLPWRRIGKLVIATASYWCATSLKSPLPEAKDSLKTTGNSGTSLSGVAAGGTWGSVVCRRR
jgi:hypothetical protein